LTPSPDEDGDEDDEEDDEEDEDEDEGEDEDGDEDDTGSNTRAEVGTGTYEVCADPSSSSQATESVFRVPRR
jgi:hypothetical protein